MDREAPRANWAAVCVAAALLAGCLAREERSGAPGALPETASAAPSGAKPPAPPAAPKAPRASAAPKAPAPEAAPAEKPFPENPSLADYLAWAGQHNPGVQAAHKQWQAALARVPQAKALPDPALRYQAAIARDMRTHEITVEQMLPWFGKLDLRAAVAQEEAAAAEQRYEAEKLRLDYDVKNAYYEYYYLARSIAVVRETRDLVKYLEEVALARYKTAAAGHPDVIRAQVELGKLEDDLRTVEDSRGAAAARLNAALSRPMEAALPWPDAIAQEPVDVTDPEVLALAREASPDLRGLQHDIAREERSVELAKKDYWPDLGVGVGYMNNREIMERSEDHMVVGMLSVTLPIWRDKYAAGVREAELRRDSALKLRAERENRLGADVKMALYKLRDARRKISLYRDTLVPRAREAMKATEAAFRAGSVPFADLVDAERMLLDFQLDYERALADHAQRLAELEMLVGRPMPRPAPAK